MWPWLSWLQRKSKEHNQHKMHLWHQQEWNTSPPKEMHIKSSVSDIDHSGDLQLSVFPTIYLHSIASLLQKLNHRVWRGHFGKIGPCSVLPLWENHCGNSHLENRENCTFSSAFPHCLTWESPFPEQLNSNSPKFSLNTQTMRSKITQNFWIWYIVNKQQIG